MKNLLFTFIVLLNTAFTSVHAACFYPKGGTPVVPNPNNATDREMMEARLKAES